MQSGKFQSLCNEFDGDDDDFEGPFGAVPAPEDPDVEEYGRMFSPHICHWPASASPLRYCAILCNFSEQL